MFVPLLKILFSHWMEKETIPRSFTRSVVKLLHKKKHGEDVIGNFHD